MTKLLVGLGNPGEKYEKTRHNIGFMALESFLKENNFTWKKTEKDQRYSLLNLFGSRFIALEPLTFMNESGRSVKYIKERFKIESKDILVIHDDLDMPNGRIKIKVEKSSGGHHGVGDIMQALGKKDFINLKIGIDHPQTQSVVSWVLGRFSQTQMGEISDAINKSSDIITDFIEGFNANKLMNKYNGYAKNQ
ncbi:MAG: aminoacyl-tRNA hydrolase [Bombilactobacillus mellifer]|nr:aminoacyl-tRNA hydrolase [Bombilactobacillus mellifer]